MSSLRLMIALFVLVPSGTALAAHAAPPGDTVLEWDLRVRYEGVQDDALARSADAATARLRLGLRLSPAPGWTGLVEGEAIAGNQRYNSGANGRTAYPAVIDPRGVELNQAWLGWKGARAAATVVALDLVRAQHGMGGHRFFSLLQVRAGPVQTVLVFMNSSRPSWPSSRP